MSKEINNPFEKKKAYTFRTNHIKKYTLVMHSDLIENETRLYLYVGEPFLYSFFGGWLEEENEPVREEIAGPNTIIEKLIYKMVGDYEICLHHHHVVKHMDREIEIDHAEELRKRRARIVTPKEEKQEENTVKTRDYEIPIYDWQAAKEPEKTEEEQFYDELKETARTKGMSEESLKQLKQNKDKILKFESRKAQ
jgi:hypothetical protein